MKQQEVVDAVMKHHMEENEQLRSLSMKREEQLQALHERVSSLEKTLSPCQKENVRLRLEIDSLKEENEKYKIAFDMVKPVEKQVHM
ncbi:hypothetical protein TELCIR_21561 [Teladorsagia circumcincta]|uniref:Uncharacterized protein n=1 Tax=Teladorsagia circumcincta TaxID=45464 RepID=A0A2G9TGF4_TELCI|nr:hypothetical protein TELCIR_21561 [Teladorsagia circumcincta]